MSLARGEWKDFEAHAPDAYELVSALGQAAAKASIDNQLLELIKLRASQINGCAIASINVWEQARSGLSLDPAIAAKIAAGGTPALVLGAFLGVGTDHAFRHGMRHGGRRW